jgi:hypothetical protein
VKREPFHLQSKSGASVGLDLAWGVQSGQFLGWKRDSPLWWKTLLLKPRVSKTVIASGWPVSGWSRPKWSAPHYQKICFNCHQLTCRLISSYYPFYFQVDSKKLFLHSHCA